VKSAELKECPQCGAKHSGDGPGGTCPACLLGLAVSDPAPSDSFSAKPATITEVSTLPLTEGPGSVIGRYKLLQKIGEGGCGVVYMAEQEAPVQRRVALKLVKMGMDTKQVIARFDAERQALAMMEHPNIARVFDAGATETGRPYFVMELVRGLKITEYCDQRNLSTRDRLKLFVQVCQAVQHAHQKGIIHRDLKPSNILVTVMDGVAVPKVIDFGIAKATQGRLTDQTLFTAFEQFIGTPAYMSPEQAELTSLDVDTRSDIYSLGVLLYELLTGTIPFDTGALLKAGLDALRRTIREEEPKRPSTRLSAMVKEELTTAAKRRQIEPLKLIHLLRGDLDWIVMKCLEKDRAYRYDTANSLAMDVQRFLADEAIVARPPTKLYRLQKLVRRNKLLFAAVGAVVLALVFGLVVCTWLLIREREARAQAASALKVSEVALKNESRYRRQAESNEKKARKEGAKSQQVARLLKDMLSIGPHAALGRDTTMLQEILAKGVERFETELKDQPEVEAELRLIVGGTYLELGKFKEAEAMTRRVFEIYRGLPGEEMPYAIELWSNLADALSGQQKHAEAEEAAREALRLRQALPGDNRVDVGHSLLTLGLLGLSQADLLQDAESRSRALERAEMMEREAIEDFKGITNESSDLAAAIKSLGLILQAQGKASQAGGLFAEALAMQIRTLGEDNLVVASSLGSLGNFLRDQGDVRKAEDLLRKALAIQQKFCGNDHIQVAITLGSLAALFQRQGRLQEAELTVREALRINRKVLGEAHPMIPSTLTQLGDVLRDEGKLAEAESTFREVLTKRRKVLGDDHPEICDSLEKLANVLLLEHKNAEAQQLLEELPASIANQEEGAKRFFVRANLRAALARFSEAASDFKRAIELRPELAEAWFWLAPILAREAKPEIYREHCRRTLEQFGAATDPVVAERTAKVCLILPSSGADLERVTRLADLALSAGTNHWAITWFGFTKGLAEYRRGAFSSAAEMMSKVLAQAGDELNRDVAAYMVLAMAYYRSGLTERARAALEKGKEMIETQLPKLEGGDLGIGWDDWIIALLLKDEATALIGGQSAAHEK
jgi:tetratricopeptide (TPR) repeat protein/tRNA A-37 threonylcarbamoyl transferase component Bud32